MIRENNAEFFSALEKALSELNLDVKQSDNSGAPQIGKGLIVRVPLSSDNDIFVLTELALCEFDNDSLYFLSMLSTIITEADSSALSDLTEVVYGIINPSCPVGSFGVLRESGTVYHKYEIVLDDVTEQGECMYETVRALTVIHDIISAFYPDIMRAAFQNGPYEPVVS